MSLTIRKITSLSVALGFLSQAVLAAPAESSLWDHRRKTVQLARLPQSLVHNVPQVQASLPTKNTPAFSGTILSSRLQDVLNHIPRSFSTIQSVHPSTKKDAPVVVIVQDIHMNPEAQGNIARVLQELIQHDKVDAVGVEGAFGPIDFAPFRAFPDKEVTKNVATLFLEDNILAAPSFVGVTSEKAPPPFIGVDDRIHHENNVKAYLESRTAKAAIQEDLSKLARRLTAEKKSVYSSTLKTLDGFQAAYHNGSIGFGAYVKKLAQFSNDVDIEIEQFLAAYKMESSINFEKAERERKKVLEKLTRSLNDTDMANLLGQSVAYRMGRLSYGDYYSYLKTLCVKAKIDLQQTPVFDDYIRYVLLSDGIKAEVLFDAVERLEGKAFENLIETEEQRALVQRSQHHQLMEKLVRFELTPAEWEEYKAIFNLPFTIYNEFTVTNDHLNEPMEIGHGKFNVNGKLKIENQNLASFETFYHEADIRSAKMVENLFQEASHSTLVLVTGGFHTSDVLSQLKKRNASVIVASPKLSKVDLESGSAYLSVFAREKTPLDRLLAGEKLFIRAKEVGVQHFVTGLKLRGALALVSGQSRVSLATVGGGQLDATDAVKKTDTVVARPFPISKEKKGHLVLRKAAVYWIFGASLWETWVFHDFLFNFLNTTASPWIAVLLVALLFSVSHLALSLVLHKDKSRLNRMKDSAILFGLSIVFSLPFVFSALTMASPFFTTFLVHAAYNFLVLWKFSFLPLASLFADPAQQAAADYLKANYNDGIKIYLAGLDRWTEEKISEFIVQLGIAANIIVYNESESRLEFIQRRGVLHLQQLEGVFEEYLRRDQLESEEQQADAARISNDQAGMLRVYLPSLGKFDEWSPLHVLVGIAEGKVSFDRSDDRWVSKPGWGSFHANAKQEKYIGAFAKAQSKFGPDVRTIDQALETLTTPGAEPDRLAPGVLDIFSRLSSLHDKGVVEWLAIAYRKNQNNANVVRLVLALNQAEEYEEFVQARLRPLGNNIVPLVKSVIERGLTNQQHEDVKNGPNIFAVAADLLGRIGTVESKKALFELAGSKNAFFPRINRNLGYDFLQKPIETYFAGPFQAALLEIMDKDGTSPIPTLGDADLPFLDSIERDKVNRLIRDLQAYRERSSPYNLGEMVAAVSNLTLYLSRYGYVISFLPSAIVPDSYGLYLGRIVKRIPQKTKEGEDIEVLLVETVRGETSFGGYQRGLRSPVVILDRERLKELKDKLLHGDHLMKSGKGERLLPRERLSVIAYARYGITTEEIEEHVIGLSVAHEMRHYHDADVIPTRLNSNFNQFLPGDVISNIVNKKRMAWEEKQRWLRRSAREFSAALAELGVGPLPEDSLAIILERAERLLYDIQASGVNEAPISQYDVMAASIISELLAFLNKKSKTRQRWTSFFQLTPDDFGEFEKNLVNLIESGELSYVDLSHFAEETLNLRFKGASLFVGSYEQGRSQLPPSPFIQGSKGVLFYPSWARNGDWKQVAWEDGLSPAWEEIVFTSAGLAASLLLGTVWIFVAFRVAFVLLHLLTKPRAPARRTLRGPSLISGLILASFYLLYGFDISQLTGAQFFFFSLIAVLIHAAVNSIQTFRFLRRQMELKKIEDALLAFYLSQITTKEILLDRIEKEKFLIDSDGVFQLAREAGVKNLSMQEAEQIFRRAVGRYDQRVEASIYVDLAPPGEGQVIQFKDAFEGPVYIFKGGWNNVVRVSIWSKEDKKSFVIQIPSNRRTIRSGPLGRIINKGS